MFSYRLGADVNLIWPFTTIDLHKFDATLEPSMKGSMNSNHSDAYIASNPLHIPKVAAFTFFTCSLNLPKPEEKHTFVKPTGICVFVQVFRKISDTNTNPTL